jgi:hypothetical protein
LFVADGKLPTGQKDHIHPEDEEEGRTVDEAP